MVAFFISRQYSNGLRPVLEFGLIPAQAAEPPSTSHGGDLLLAYRRCNLLLISIQILKYDHSAGGSGSSMWSGRRIRSPVWSRIPRTFGFCSSLARIAATISR